MMVRCLQRLRDLTATLTEGHWILLYWDSRLFFVWIVYYLLREIGPEYRTLLPGWPTWQPPTAQCVQTAGGPDLPGFCFGLVFCWICCSVDDSFLVIPRFLFPFSVSGKVWLSFSLQCNFWEFSSPTPNVQLLIKERVTTYNTINHDHWQGVECDWCRICGLQRALHSQQQHEVIKTWF